MRSADGLPTDNAVALDDELEDDEEEEQEPPKPGTFLIRGAKIEPLRIALGKRGWNEEEDSDSLSFNLLWTIKARHVEQVSSTSGCCTRVSQARACASR